jgi:O-succinylbenzoic acid--CoA ligase
MNEENVSWDSLENRSFLNPRMPAEDSLRLNHLFQSVSDQFRAHLFLLTSGTTSESMMSQKWVALSKAAVLNSADEVNRHLQSNSKDIWLHVLPDFHIGGLGIHARAYLSGARVVRLSEWNPEQFVKLATAEKATLASLVPAQIYDLVQAGLKSPYSLRAVLVGGGAMAPVLFQKARQLGWPVLTTYGMTETCSQIATGPLSSLKSQDSSGFEIELLPHWTAKIRLSDGKLQLRGDALLTAYVGFDENGQGKVWDPREEGWLTLPDRVNLQGRKIEVLGRTQDFIKIGGESVDLARLRLILENVKVELEISSDIALIAVSDDRLGQVIHLLSDPTLTLECSFVLQDMFNKKVHAFEKIRKWSRLDSLPRTALGKFISNHESLRSIVTDRSI